MLALPQTNFRGKKLTFEEFSDLAIIGMAGLTDHLLDGRSTYHADGMYASLKAILDRHHKAQGYEVHPFERPRIDELIASLRNGKK